MKSDIKPGLNLPDKVIDSAKTRERTANPLARPLLSRFLSRASRASIHFLRYPHMESLLAG